MSWSRFIFQQWLSNDLDLDRTLIPDLDDLGVKLSSSLIVSPRTSNNEANLANITTAKAVQQENFVEDAKTEVPAIQLEVETSEMVTPKLTFKPIARPNAPFKKPEAFVDTPKQVKIPESSPKFVPIQAMKPLKTISTPTPVKMIAKKPERMMYKDLTFRAWPTTKNIKVKLVSIISNNAFYLHENNESIEEYINKYIDKEIKSYCKDKNPSEYQPM